MGHYVLNPDLAVGWWGAPCCHLDLQRIDQETLDDIHKEIEEDGYTFWTGGFWPTLEDAIADFLGTPGEFDDSEDPQAWAAKMRLTLS